MDNEAMIEAAAKAIWVQWTEMQGMDADPAGWGNSSPLYQQPYLDAARAAINAAAPFILDIAKEEWTDSWTIYDCRILALKERFGRD